MDRPILMSAPIVISLLDDRKTQTRRAVKRQQDFAEATGIYNANMGGPGGGPWWDATFAGTHRTWRFRCPYGVAGDALWVKETWQAQEAFDDLSPTAIGNVFADEHGEPWCPIRYVADGKCEGSTPQWQESPLGRTRPPIHMPRWASRLTLRVTEVRVERLQDISEADAIAEGAERCANGFWFDGSPALAGSSAAGAYYCLWEHINGPGSWQANPWVWAVSFEVIR